MSPTTYTTLSSDTVTMTISTPRAPSTVSSHVSCEQYNAVVARLDQEMHSRAQLEADLAAAREQIAYLRRRLDEQPTSRPPIPPSSFVPQKSEPTPVKLEQRQPRDKAQDKEIMSHCSDISAVRTSDNNLSKATNKSSSNLVAMAGVRKKSKKERAPKVKIPGQSRYWTPEEHKLFLEALQKFGHKDLRSISTYVGTRNMTQVRTHSQKYFMRLLREAKRQNPANSNKVAEDVRSDKDAPSASADATSTATPAERPVVKETSTGDKYSVPNTCGMTLLCLVGQDTLPV